MLFQRVNRSDAEKVYSVVYNASGTAFAVGQCVVLEVGATADGVRVTLPTAANLNAVGIVTSAIANAGYGLAQVYGFTNLALVISDSTTTQAAGFVMTPTAASGTIGGIGAKSALGTGATVAPFVLLTTVASNTTTAVTAAASVFVRCM